MSTIKDETSTSTTKIILANATVWEDWKDRFLTQAVNLNLWDYLQGTKSLFIEPTRPKTINYPLKRHSAASQSRSQTIQEGNEETERPPSVQREPTFLDLTAEGQKAFQMDWTFYQDELKLYKEQHENIRKLKDWISSNISPHYQKTCCKPTEPVTKWYENLGKAAGISKRLDNTLARNAYRNALNPPKLRNLLAWTNSWEQAMTEAKNKEVLATTRTSEWFEDFLVAIKGVLPSWAESYGINKDHKVEDESLDYRTVANDLRKKASEYTNATKIAKGSFGPFGDEYTNAIKTANGSFGPTFADEGNDHPEQGSEEKAITKRKRDSPKGRQASRKRQKASDSSGKVDTASEHLSGKVVTASNESGMVCRACEAPHPTLKCYYLFPHKAPRLWIPKPRVQKLVEEALKEDSTLKEEVERLNRTKRAKINDDED